MDIRATRSEHFSMFSASNRVTRQTFHRVNDLAEGHNPDKLLEYAKTVAGGFTQ